MFAECGIVPSGRLAATPAEAVSAARDLGYPAMLKAQVVDGGRRKAGAVVQVGDDAAARTEAAPLFAASVRGRRGEALLVERRVSAQHEFCISYLLDYASERLWFLFSVLGKADADAPPAGEVLRVPAAVRRGPDLGPLAEFCARTCGGTICSLPRSVRTWSWATTA